jgi:regulator of replication initiation timing
MRNFRSKLSYMITENDSLRKDLSKMNKSLQRSMELSTSNSSHAFLEGMAQEIESLRAEVTSMRDQRDNALKEVLILKQVSQFYKHRDEAEQRDIENQLFTL